MQTGLSLPEYIRTPQIVEKGSSIITYASGTKKNKSALVLINHTSEIYFTAAHLQSQIIYQRLASPAISKENQTTVQSYTSRNLRDEVYSSHSFNESWKGMGPRL
jgi:putative IMPACT (imprinted ancient) family translation regulator